jgi:hypothetical protein
MISYATIGRAIVEEEKQSDKTIADEHMSFPPEMGNSENW